MDTQHSARGRHRPGEYDACFGGNHYVGRSDGESMAAGAGGTRGGGRVGREDVCGARDAAETFARGEFCVWGPALARAGAESEDGIAVGAVGARGTQGDAISFGGAVHRGRRGRKSDAVWREEKEFNQARDPEKAKGMSKRRRR